MLVVVYTKCGEHEEEDGGYPPPMRGEEIVRGSSVADDEERLEFCEPAFRQGLQMQRMQSQKVCGEYRKKENTDLEPQFYKQ
jgi:hypothetical protein